ncbi:MAG: hypothetical protein NTZ60_04125 [Campylobacterales bacterium]|nr:hypothetical protein [Campylobacterales bacterium]
MRTLLLLILYFVLALNALTLDEARELALSKGLKAIPKNYQSLQLLVNDPQNSMNVQKIECNLMIKKNS